MTRLASEDGQLSLFDPEPAAPPVRPEPGGAQGTLFGAGQLPRFPVTREPEASPLGDPGLARLARSPAMRRLHRIGFLGAIDYVFHPQRWDGWQRYSRYDHSIAVAALADRFAGRRRLDPAERRTAVAAALLHDLGHGPLSHSAEPAFAALFGIDHHSRTEALIRDRSGPDAVGCLLDEASISTSEVLRLLSGRSNAPTADLFGSPLNVDTLDGIWRARRYACRQVHDHPAAAVERLADRDPGRWQASFDRFWQDKEVVYRHIVGGRIGAMADDLVDAYIRGGPAGLCAEDFFRDDRGFLRKHRALTRRLSALRRSLRASIEVGPRLDPAKELRVRRRSYTIDRTINIERTADLYKRYHRGINAEIIDRPLVSSDAFLGGPVARTGGLFPEEPDGVADSRDGSDRAGPGVHANAD